MDDETFLREFEACTLPFTQWNHRAHLRVACLYLTRYTLDEAIARIRDGIQVYNRRNRVPDGPNTGYHETMTQAYMRVMDAMIRELSNGEPTDAFLDAQPQLCSKRVLLLYYSRKRIMSAEAKKRFVKPDLAAFPVTAARDVRRSRR